MNHDPHPWCRCTARDEAVRAAEDGRQGPLPTLEEAIYRAGHFGSPEGQNDPKCTERESGLRTERVTLEVTHDCFYPASEWVLEVVQDFCNDPGESVRVVSEWDQVRESGDRVSREEGIKTLTEEVEALNKEIDRLTDERDALKARVAELEPAPAASVAAKEPVAWGVAFSKGVVVATSTSRSDAVDMQAEYACETVVVPLYAVAPLARGWLTDEEQELIAEENGKLKARVTELEANANTAAILAKIRETEWLVASKLAAEANAELSAAPAASGAANSSGSPNSSEPVAWGVMRNARVDAVTYLLRSSAELATEGFGGTVVPLYTSQPLARGWLTDEEREAVEFLASLDVPPYVEAARKSARIGKALLARSSPPEVVLPPMPDCCPMADYGAAWRDCLIAVREALRQAGVTVTQPLPPRPEDGG